MSDFTENLAARSSETSLQNTLDSLDYWRLCDSLSVFQAALLIVGLDPSGECSYAEEWPIHQRPNGYEAARTAIANSLKKGRIEGQIIATQLYDINNNPYGEIEGSVDVMESTVDVESLKDWLRSRGFNKGFFFPKVQESTDYLNPSHPRYAPKLAAAVRAWEAVTEPTGKSPKQELMIWLRKHASEYNLLNDDGNPFESAVDEISKVANWSLGGGAPKTPSKK